MEFQKTMAKKESLVTFDAVMRDLQAGQFKPIYLLQGEESYYIDRITDYIAEHALREEERDFNQTVVFGSDVTAAQIADLARRYPMMAERQVVIVKEAQNIKNWDQVENYLEKPQPTTVLVIAYKNGTVDGRKKIASRIAQAGVVFESKKKRDYELPGFIAGYLQTKNCTIDNKAALMIAEHIGADLNRMTSELDKLTLSLGEDKKVTPDIVEQQIGLSKDFNGFELRNAIANRDVLKANKIVNYFDKNPKSGGPFSLFPMLFNFFQNLLLAYYAPNRNNENDVAKYLELRGGAWAAREYVTSMRHFSGTKVMQIIDKIRETDAKMKGLDNPNTPPGELMRELISFIFH